MLPTDEQVDEIFAEVKTLCTKNNVGFGWIDHCIFTSNITSVLASRLNLDERLARLGGLFHDVGRCLQTDNIRGWRFHEIAGYKFMMEKGYPELARFCITHGIVDKSVLGMNEDKHFCDIDKSDVDLYINYMKNTPFNDYDKLIQLADNLAVRDGYVTLEQRVIDLMKRRDCNGPYWIYFFDLVLKLKDEIEEKINAYVYDIVPQFYEYSLKFKYDNQNTPGNKK